MQYGMKVPYLAYCSGQPNISYVTCLPPFTTVVLDTTIVCRAPTSARRLSVVALLQQCHDRESDTTLYTRV